MNKMLIATLSLALTAAALAHAGHDEATTFTLSEKDAVFTLDGPASVAPGYTAFAFSNTAGQPFAPVVARLKGNVSDADVKAALGELMASHGENMSAIEKIAEFTGGSAGVMPGGTFEFGTTLTPGRYVVFGFGASEDGKPLYDLGQYRCRRSERRYGAQGGREGHLAGLQGRAPRDREGREAGVGGLQCGPGDASRDADAAQGRQKGVGRGSLLQGARPLPGR